MASELGTSRNAAVDKLAHLVGAQLYDLAGQVRTERLNGADLARLTNVLYDLSEYTRELASTALRELDQAYPDRPGEDGLSEVRLQLTERALEVAAALAADALEAVEKLARHGADHTI